MPAPELWYALAAHARQEKAAAASLAEKGFEVYLPLRQERRPWSDRIKTVELALFPGYLFCRAALDAEALRQLLGIRQVFDLVGRLPGNPRLATAIPEEELENLRRTLESHIELEAVEGLKVGREVEIGAGPLKGVRGIVVEEPGTCHLIVQIQLLGRGVRAQVELDDLL